MVSTETEKRGAEFKKKLENYLEQNREKVPINREQIGND